MLRRVPWLWAAVVCCWVTCRSPAYSSPKHLWRNKVPKVERLESLQMHFQRLQSKMAQTETWKTMSPETFCLAVEEHIEADFIGKESEEKISSRCHKLLRKLGRAMRLGWEWELLDLEAPCTESTEDYREVLQRLQSLGPRKQAEYRRIKAGDRHGGSIGRSANASDGEDYIPSAEEYSSAVASQAMTVWHRQAMALAEEVLKDAKVEHLLDIGTSFNPLQDAFPKVTAIDLVPGDHTVLMADFLKVKLRDDLAQVEVDPADSQRVIAVPTEHFDGALLSMVLRALSRTSGAQHKAQRRAMLRRAARCVRADGVVVVVERSPLGTMVNAPFQDAFWSRARLKWRKTLRSLRGTNVYILDRLPGNVVEEEVVVNDPNEESLQLESQ